MTKGTWRLSRKKKKGWVVKTHEKQTRDEKEYWDSEEDPSGTEAEVEEPEPFNKCNNHVTYRAVIDKINGRVTGLIVPLKKKDKDKVVMLKSTY
eukprot:CAMPEP_0168516626 /NCGR_PEP_ID=MMETSP0405-20121227/5514_1 /TAXON_ID=498012 /ORGANISM="Trichosphaerium sp, Strain Am-I-7 wt" /LENGTH=93 /DNA_ID=CAMNT_0008536373 /DNA_START=301 /DNA_END=582 /DNA_ORIENTATION=+